MPPRGSREDTDLAEDPIRGMVKTWIFCMALPAAAVAWRYFCCRHDSSSAGSGGSSSGACPSSYPWWATTIFAAFAMPLLAILQGSLSILNFRLRFGDAPVPRTPVHGVVVSTTATTTTTEDAKLGNNGTRRSADQQQRREKNEFVDPALLDRAGNQPPIRLLVIGDSLAIGVGQSSNATPVMPEVVARTVSRRLDGRAVYWTCHGAPGASTGWIVRELERGVFHHQQQRQNVDDDDEDDDDVVPLSSPRQLRRRRQQTKQEGQRHGEVQFVKAQSCLFGAGGGSSSSASETDDSSSSSSSDESSDEDESGSLLNSAPQHLDRDGGDRRGAGHNLPPPSSSNSSTYQRVESWKERLEHHRSRFTKDVLGPYDIVVVLTGSNDLKSAFFPFLLSGEDAELRRQAQERGGSYTKELRLLVETLYTRMQFRWQFIRHAVVEQVEAATESVREKVEETMERFSSHHHHDQQLHHDQRYQQQCGSESQRQHQGCSFSDVCRTDSEDATAQIRHSSTSATPTTAAAMHTSKLNFSTGADADAANCCGTHLPLVVLPGMPARALPIFRILPLRWLAVPIVDIMDMHKRNLARSHPEQVLFVRAPAVEDLAEYESRHGPLWSERCSEGTVLELRDVRRRDSRRIEHAMLDYYGSKNSSSFSRWCRLKRALLSPWSSSSAQVGSGSNLFSLDQIHPNDEGYDFWGRFIGNRIVDEWLSRTSAPDQ